MKKVIITALIMLLFLMPINHTEAAIYYYYDKYTTVQTVTGYVPGPFTGTYRVEYSALSHYSAYHEDMAFDRATGTYYLSGCKTQKYDSEISTYTCTTPWAYNEMQYYYGEMAAIDTRDYAFPDAKKYSDTYIYRLEREGRVNPDVSDNWYYAEFSRSDRQPIYQDSKGSLVQRNIIALDGVYPADGKHSDGYWYVKTSAVPNRAPVLTVDNTNKTLAPNQSLTMTGTIYDADNDPVTVSATIGGSTKSVIVTGTSATKAWTLTWAYTELPHGKYTNIPVTATDGRND